MTRVFALAACIVLVVAIPALACNGHEVRATNTLNDIYGDRGDVTVEATGDHYIRVTLGDGTSQTFHSTDEAMVRQAINFIEGRGTPAPREVVEDFAG